MALACDARSGRGLEFTGKWALGSAPFCRAWSSDPARDGLEIVLKGGQMGTADFFGLARDGVAWSAAG